MRLTRLSTALLFGPLALKAALAVSFVHAQAEPPRAIYPAVPGVVVAPTAPQAPVAAPPPAPAAPPPPDRRSLREAEHAQRVQERETERARRVATEQAQRDARAAERAAVRDARTAQKVATIDAREAERARRAQLGAAADEARRDARDEARAEKLALRSAREAEQKIARARWEEHRALHRVAFGVGFAPGIVIRKLPGDGSGQRRDLASVRQRIVEFGLAYLHDFNPYIGLRAGAAWGVGVTRLDLDLHGSDCCGDGSRKLDPSYALTFEVAPTFNVSRIGLYGSSGLALRMLFLPQASAVVSADSFDRRDDFVETVSRRVRFASPTVALALRLGVGYRFGRNHEYDFGLGFDAGPALGTSALYTSMFMRFSVAFTDIAFGR